MPYAGVIRKIRERRLSLRDKKAKSLLKKLIRSEIPWRKIEKILNRTYKNIGAVIKSHFPQSGRLSRKTNKLFPEVETVIRKIQAESFKVKNLKESNDLAKRLGVEVNRILEDKNYAPVIMHTIRKDWMINKMRLRWGWPRPGVPEKTKEIINKWYKKSQDIKTQEESTKARELLLEEVSAFRIKEGLSPIKPSSIAHMATVEMRLSWGWPKKNDDQKKNDKDVKKEAEAKALEIVEERNWEEPLVLKVDAEAWGRPGVRIGFFSRVDYGSSGYRAGLLELDYEVFKKEGVHFIVLLGGLIDKRSIKKQIRRLTRGQPAELKALIIERYLNQVAKELSCAIPKLKKPSGNEFIRLYIVPSRVYDGSSREDGEYGEEIVRRLVHLRHEDMRQFNTGGDKIELKLKPIKQENKFIWVIVPRKHRLPSKYYSAAAEREIDDREGQTSQDWPEMWIVGTQASCVIKPRGERKRPYATLPGNHRLEEVTIAENQVGVTILEYTDKNLFVFRAYDFKDTIKNERDFITGIKEGATEIHKKIVELIKKRGAMTVGLLTDALGIDRKLVEESIKFLVEPKMLPRRTWPGLHHNEDSQRYNFHLDWIQQKLRYRLPALDKLREESMVFFGCLHAGYTTTDYEFFVKDLPNFLIDNQVDNLCGVGDFVAGLKHNFMCNGEIIGSLNITEQEQFAAELVGTVMMKVFSHRFKKLLGDNKKIDTDLLERKIDNCLMKFTYVAGNHDAWQQEFGSTPLVVFREKLIRIINSYILKILEDEDLPIVNLDKLINAKLIELPDYAAVCKLQSGLTMELYHPRMARAGTTSLRAQHMIDVSKEAQVIGAANFHTAIVVHKWQPDIGQRVCAQVGTIVIFTHFEHHKLKVVDFGVVLLRVASNNERIVRTDTAFYGESRIKGPREKGIDILKLKNDLGLIICE